MPVISARFVMFGSSGAGRWGPARWSGNPTTEGSAGRGGAVLGQDVGQRLVEGDLGLPARGLAELGVVASEHGGLDLSLEGGVGLQPHGPIGQGDEVLGELTDREVPTGADVV